MSPAESNQKALKTLLESIEPDQALQVLQSLFLSYVQRTEYCQLSKRERANIVFVTGVMKEFFTVLQPEKPVSL